MLANGQIIFASPYFAEFATFADFEIKFVHSNPMFLTLLNTDLFKVIPIAKKLFYTVAKNFSRR